MFSLHREEEIFSPRLLSNNESHNETPFATSFRRIKTRNIIVHNENSLWILKNLFSFVSFRHFSFFILNECLRISLDDIILLFITTLLASIITKILLNKADEVFVSWIFLFLNYDAWWRCWKKRKARTEHVPRSQL